MRIQVAHAIVLVLHCTMAAATVSCLVAMQRALVREQLALRNQSDAAAAMQDFREGNQLLSGTALTAATSGTVSQTDRYWQELLVARRRERASMVMQRLELIAREHTIWQQAQAISDALVKRQQQALAAIDQGNRTRAMALLVDPITLQQQENVRFLSESLQRRLDERFRFSLTVERTQENNLWQLLMLLVVVDLALVLTVLLVFTPRFVTRPLTRLNRHVRERLQGQSCPQPALHGAATEIQELAISLAGQQQLEQALIEAEWIKTEQSRIGEALQREVTLSNVGRCLLQELGRTLQLGSAALYGLDERRQVLHLLASYASGNLPTQVEPGEGLVGECFTQGKPLEVNALPDDYLRIRSGLGQSPPERLWLLPVRSGEQVLAILELALLKPLASPQRQLVQDLLPLLALAQERMNNNQPQPMEPCHR